MLLENSIFYNSSKFGSLQRIIDYLFAIIVFSQDIPSRYTSIYFILLFLVIHNLFKSLYKSFRIRSIFKISINVFSVIFILSLSNIFLNYIFIDNYNFGFKNYFSNTYSFFVYFIFSHIITRIILRLYRKKGRNTKSIIILANNIIARNIYIEIYKSNWMGLRVARWFSPIQDDNFKYDGKLIKSVGSLEDMKLYLNNHNAEFIIFSECDNYYSMDQVLSLLGDTNYKVYYYPNWSNSTLSMEGVQFGSKKLISIWEKKDSALISLFFKRLCDFVFSIIIALILMPLFLLVIVILFLKYKKNVFYTQKRYGLNGVVFNIYKFRTMYVCDSGEKDQLMQAFKNDSRVTPIGAILRKYSIDELPQLLNVLRGEMSLVGPRPHAVSHNEFYRSKIKGYMQRHSLKPGMTGLAQVHGLRGETKTIKDMQKRVENDLNYINDWDLILDLKILLKTIKLLITNTAY